MAQELSLGEFDFIDGSCLRGVHEKQKAGRVYSHGSLPVLTREVHSQLCFHAILRVWLAWAAGCPGWCKSVPIGTVFRSKGQKCTKLVRFSGFLVLLSRFVVVVHGIIPARAWIREGGWAGFLAAARELKPIPPPGKLNGEGANMTGIAACLPMFCSSWFFPRIPSVRESGFLWPGCSWLFLALCGQPL